MDFPNFIFNDTIAVCVNCNANVTLKFACLKITKGGLGGGTLLYVLLMHDAWLVLYVSIPPMAVVGGDVFSEWEVQREHHVADTGMMALLWPEGEVQGLRRCEVFSCASPLSSLLTCDLEEARAWRCSSAGCIVITALAHG